MSKYHPDEDRYEARREAEKQRYLSTLTDTGRSRFHAIRSHQFADSIGGDASNYRF